MAKMEYVTLRGTDICVSRLALGTDVFGSSLSEKDSYNLIDYYLANGGNVLDTAHIYGNWIPGERHPSECTLGRYMKNRGCREKIIISTKGAHPELGSPDMRLSHDEIIGDIDSSLLCLGIDCIDLYWLHRDDTSRGVDDIMETLGEIVRTGKARCIGASNWSAARIAQANEYAEAHGLPKFIASQIQYACAEVNLDTIDKTLVVMNDHEKEFYRNSGMPVFAFSSQGKGYFSKRERGEISGGLEHMYSNAENDRRYNILRKISSENGYTVGQNAVAFLTSQNIDVIPILGCKKINQLSESMACAELRIDISEF